MIEKIEITQRFNFKKSQKHYECFIIDMVNKNAYFNINEMMYPYQFFEKNYSSDTLSESILNDLKSRVSSNIYHLDENSVSLFEKEFIKLNLFDGFESRTFPYFEKLENIYTCTINLYFSEKYEEFSIKNCFPSKWADFNDLLIRLFNFDVLNFNTLKHIVTDLFYDIKSDGIYDNAGNKLSLTSLEFGHFQSYESPHQNILIDFNRSTIDGYFEKENVDSAVIFELFEKYGLYQWIFEDYQEKSKNHDSPVLNEYDWYLELVFNNSVIWNISGHDEYPDTYVCLASDVEKLTGYDLLEIESIPPEEIELFNYYGKMKIH